MELSYRSFTKSAVFRLDAPHAQQVLLVVRSPKGDKTLTRPLRKAVDGVWHATVDLSRGRCYYRFLVDNVPTLDPSSRGTIADDHGEQWSMREIGH